MGVENKGTGCYGTREATDVSEEDMFIGIPALLLSQIVKGLKGSLRKTIIKARGKASIALTVARI